MAPGTIKEALTFLRFGLSGLPGFILAIAANVLLIEVAHVPKPVAYLFVIWLQMTMGFIMCRTLVFSSANNKSLWHSYLQFALSMGLIRILDWSLYTALVEFLHIYYVAAQVLCSFVFLGVKFLSAKAIFRPAR
jgi:putative flippase GtrA